MKYRISEGVLLREDSKGHINALVGGKWQIYPGMYKDWDHSSRPASKEEVNQFLKGVKQ